MDTLAPAVGRISSESSVAAAPEARFARLAWGVIGFTLAVIVWGAFVRATGSGAGCGSHWPLCNGAVIPQNASTRTWIEFSHRLTSGMSLLAVFYLGIRARRIFPPGSLTRKFALASMIAIVVEALIGAMLVLLKLVEADQSVSRAVSISLHLANTSILMAVLTLTAFAASRPRLSFNFYRKGLVWTGAILAFGFILVGMSGAIAALGDTLFKPETLVEGFRQDLALDSHFLLRLRVFHPFLAAAWAVGVVSWLPGFRERLGLSAAESVHAPEARALRARSWQTIGLVLFNVGFGIVNLGLLAPIGMQLGHLLLANLVWISFILTLAEGFSLKPAKHLAQ